jgi:pumilio family protein 6
VQATVTLWEKLRPKSTSKEEKEQLAAIILKQVKGHIVDLANNHTASRVIQFCAKSSAAAERRLLMAEVKDNVVALAKSKYGHFLVQKLVSISSKEEMPGGWRLGGSGCEGGGGAAGPPRSGQGVRTSRAPPPPPPPPP